MPPIFAGAFFIPMEDRRFTFPAAEKLKSRKLIQQLFASGKTIHVPPVTCHFLMNPAVLSVPLQVGVGVSARQFKKATDRNRIKRLLREAYRLNKHEIHIALTETEQALVVFLLYNGKELPNFQIIERTVQQVLGMLVARIASSANARH
jgi:ribonuclease P protein component